jgi:hypothetical protein
MSTFLAMVHQLVSFAGIISRYEHTFVIWVVECLPFS